MSTSGGAAAEAGGSAREPNNVEAGGSAREQNMDKREGKGGIRGRLAAWSLALAAVWPGELGHAQDYGGVVPGAHANPSNSAPKGEPRVTWPGFQVLGDGRTRIFVQTNAPVSPELKREGSSWVVVIPNVLLPRGNARLPLDTHFFNTPVTSARLRPLATREKRRKKSQAGTGVSLLLEMRAEVTPKLYTEKDASGYFFTYVEFAAGTYN